MLSITPLTAPTLGSALSAFPPVRAESSQVSREAQYRDRVLSILERILANDPDADAHKVTLAKGEKLLTQDHQLAQHLQGRELILVHGELSAPSTTGATILGPGYSILKPAGFLQRLGTTGATAATDDVTLISVPSEQFSLWIEKEPGFAEAVTTAIKASHPQSRFPDVTREAIRRVRDENLRHVVFHDCIKLVNEAGGIFDIINPTRQSFLKHEFTTRLVSPEEQAFLLVEAVSPVFLHKANDEIVELAKRARAQADAIGNVPEFEKVGIAFQQLSALLRSASAEEVAAQLPEFSKALEQARDRSQLDWLEVTQRVLQIKWLEYVTERDSDHSSDWDTRLTTELRKFGADTAQALRSIREILDQTMEPLVEAATRADPPKVTKLGFRRFDVAVSLGSEAWTKDIELREDSDEFRLLRHLAQQLASGDRSAVGGDKYVQRRFPLELLEGIARDKIKVVFYDGPHREGIEWARHKFGATDSDPSVVRGCLEMEIAGTYGDFSRSWITFRNGESVVVVSQDGSPIRNAAAVLLYQTQNNETVSFENIYMVRHRHSLDTRIAQDLEGILRDENARLASSTVHGKSITDPAKLQTHLLILDRPEEFMATMGEYLETRVVPSKVLGTLRIGYWRDKNNEIQRVLMPTVGSRGLYGDSAGTFVKAFFESPQILEPVPHVIFTGSAGTFAGSAADFEKQGLRGLPRGVDRGRLVAPSRSVTYKNEEIPFETLSARAQSILAQHHSAALATQLREFQTRERVAQVNKVDKHYSIEAPALETRDGIEEIYRTGHASIDVEGGPIGRALRGLDRDITFTPIYTSSDDPRQALNDESKSLAYGGVLFEGKRPQPDLQKLIRSLLMLGNEVNRPQSRR